MATVDGFNYTHEGTLAPAHTRRYALPAASGGTTTTCYYRTSLGVRGSTTDVSAIPAGAVIERIA